MFKRNAATMLEKNILLFRGTNSIKHEFSVGNDDETFRAYIGKQRTIERETKGSKVSARLAKNWTIPNRALSAFVTRSADHAIGFGHLMLVIPADNVEMYGWSKTDFNMPKDGQFREKLQSVEYYMTRIYGVLANLGETSTSITRRLASIMHRANVTAADAKKFHGEIESKESTEFFDILLSHVDELDKLRLDDDNPLSYIRVVDHLENCKNALESLSMESVAEVFEEASKESFELTTFKELGDIPKAGPSYDELWFTGDFIGVFIDEYSDDHRGDAKSVLKAILK